MPEYKFTYSATNTEDLQDLHVKLQGKCKEVEGLFLNGNKLTVFCDKTIPPATQRVIDEYLSTYIAPPIPTSEVTPLYDNITTIGSLSANRVVSSVGSLTQLYFGTQTGNNVLTSTASVTADLWAGSLSGNTATFGTFSAKTGSMSGDMYVGSNLNVNGTLKSPVLNVPNSSFTGQYTDLSNLPWISILNNCVPTTNVLLAMGTTTTDSQGVAKVTLSNQANKSTFSKVIFAAATAATDTSIITSTYHCAIKKITTTSPSSITFNVVSSQGLWAPSGVNIYAVVIGT